jgi:hypothetical protein
MTQCARNAIGRLWQFHAATLFYFALMAVLILSVYDDSGMTYLRVNILYTFLLFFAYVLANATLRKYFQRIASCMQFHGRWKCYEQPVAAALDVLVVVFPILYFMAGGYVPFVRLMYMTDYYAASGLRQNFYNGLSTFMNYGGEYFLRGIAPVWLIYCYLNRRKVFYAALAVTSFTALGVITKASIVILLFPLLAVQCARRDWRQVALTGAITTLVLLLNVTVLYYIGITHKPGHRHIPAAQQVVDNSIRAKLMANYNELEIAAEGIWIRLFSVQGEIVHEWLETFPADKGFQHGCGYRWYAPIAGCEFVKLPDMVWMKYYANLNHKYGLVGTVSAPHYINAYANFGDTGVLLSAIGMAILLVLLNCIFTNPVYNIAFNASYLALALQTPLTALLNSSGWALMIVMYVVFFPRERATQE